LDDGVGANRGAVGQERDRAAEGFELEPDGCRARSQPIDHPAREVLRRRRHLDRVHASFPIDHHAIGERAADVDADEVRACFRRRGHTVPMSWRSYRLEPDRWPLRVAAIARRTAYPPPGHGSGWGAAVSSTDRKSTRLNSSHVKIS